MSVKTIVCELCGKEVTKRKSLSLKEIGLGDGRACRDHTEVVEAVERMQEAQRQRKVSQEAHEIMQVISIASCVRVYSTVRGMDPEYIYYKLKMQGVPKRVIDKAKEEVSKQGGPKMSSDEMLTSMIAYGQFHKSVNSVGERNE